MVSHCFPLVDIIVSVIEMLKQESQTRILILGSCVSRDILNFDDAAQFKLVDYYARSSLASLGSNPSNVNDDDLLRITSPFQRRMVARDIQKSFYCDALQSKEFDVLLIDLVDERFDIFEMAPDSFVTLSSELFSSGLVATSQRDSENWIVSGSDRHRRLWVEGMERLFSELKILELTDRVVINRVFWADSLEDGSPLPAPFSTAVIKQANIHLGWMYEQLERFLAPNKWLYFPGAVLRANPQHQWGVSPFHYCEEYYRAAIDALNASIAMMNSERVPDMSTIPEKKIETPSLVEYAINEVTFIIDCDVLVATVVVNNPVGGQYAFYVFRNEERIHMQWYSASPILRFDTKAKPGLYRVYSFLQSPDGKRTAKYSKPIFLHPSTFTLSSQNKPESEDRALQFEGLNWKFPALYFSSEHPRLFILPSGATDRNKITLPYFNRWTWAAAGKFPGHVLCIGDPTLELHDEMRLGWYLGKDTHDATDELCSFVQRFAETLGIPEDKIVFWGSSGGGFAALALASRIEGSTAVAINAQTDALAYHVAGVVDMVRDLCFDGRSAVDIQQMFGRRVNMEKAWVNNRNSRAILVQNKLDTHHYNCHFQSYWTALGGNPEGGWTADGRHCAWLYEDKRGHGPESEQMVVEILRLIDDDTGTVSPEMPGTGPSLT